MNAPFDLRHDQDEADTAAAREMIARFRAESDEPSGVLALVFGMVIGATMMLALCLFFAPMLGAGQ
ncbi:hypothetical protein [Novosphingobium olei]|uniref:Uncharacterized protein n=1 Tax=Novosphingobium olei TaxID=2728851 RepID=A0A7Y0G938_9SPHN|nr:hypothetical protein [Novosphingobium olei]NML93771.1 hypothetical protein [Novosphingobium olei]